MKRIVWWAAIFSFFVVSCAYSFSFLPKKLGSVVVLSISSDGRYVISSNSNKGIILWDIKNKTHRILSTNGNIYSAYFIKNSSYFVWQDLNNYVHVDSVFGKKILKFKNFPVYGQVMSSDLKTYIASDINWQVYEGYGESQKIIKKDKGAFLGYQKLLNLTLSPNGKLLLTTGFGSGWDENKLIFGPDQINKNYFAPSGFSLLEGVVLWDLKTGQPVKKLPGNDTHVIGTFSPDGSYVVAGDLDYFGYVWNFKTKKRFMLRDLLYGLLTYLPNGKAKWDKRGMIPVPKKFRDFQGQMRIGIFAVKFIDKDHYLRFTIGIPYAILYKVDDPKPLKYLFLGKSPWPSVDDYLRDESIDTAPKSHILVMGQLKGNGIIVYKYNPKNQTLKKIWIGNV